MIRLTPSFPEAEQALTDTEARGIDGAVVPVFYEIDAGVAARCELDPARAYELTAEGPYAGIVSTAAMTIVAPSPSLVYVGDGALDHVDAGIAAHMADIGPSVPPFVGGALGMLTHEFLTTLEPTVPVATGGQREPGAVFMRVDDSIVFDHVTGRLLLVSTIKRGAQSLEAAYEQAQRRLDDLYRTLTVTVDTRANAQEQQSQITPDVRVSVSDANFEQLVERALEHITAGDVVQVVLSRTFEQDFAADPLDLFRELRASAPAQYHTLLRLDGTHVVGASPEQLIGVRDGRVATNPIAGTRPRGATVAADAMLAHELRACPKERAEHMMLVDLGRNDVSRVCTPGTVDVTRLATIEHGSHVMHLVSRVEGQLLEGMTPIDALRACFPAGTLTGAPKVRAAQLIAELEGERRGAYGGAIGYIGHGGCLDMSITIRSAVIADGVARVQTGAGIVARSVPRMERRETEQKARGMLEAIARVHGAATDTPAITVVAEPAVAC